MNCRRYSEARQLFVVAWKLAQDFSKELCEEIVNHFIDLCFITKDYSRVLNKLVYNGKNSSAKDAKVCDLSYLKLVDLSVNFLRVY